MTEPNQQCPPAWTLITSPVRTCGRTSAASRTCDSVIFPVNGITYSRVCGRVRAYQVGYTSAFFDYIIGEQASIDSSYVSDVIISHGSSPRQHVWTFASAVYEQIFNIEENCPCTNIDNPNPMNFQTPPFVGNDYFCDTGADTQPSTIQFLSDDPLWDGEGCGPTSTCCGLNNPPWFCKQLPAPTNDDIEVRLCLSQNNQNENVAVEQVELYVL